ncbi:unnamed protein product, partial [marine sediment metagenome]
MKKVMDELWIKVVGGIAIAAISGFVSAALGVRVAQAKMKIKQESMEKTILENFHAITKLLER